MRALTVLAVALVLSALSVDAKRPKWHELDGYSFEQYRADFKKPYSPSDLGYETRKAHFEANLKHIKALNADATRTWRAGVNMFTDMSVAEFAKYNRYRREGSDKFYAMASKVHGAPAAGDVPLPQTVDWRTATSPRVLTAVKHQGACGSCWAHSAAENMESQYALLTGMLPVLSVGQINSCTPESYNCAGCDGGLSVGAWAYLANTSVQRADILKSVTENWAYPIPVKDWFFDDQPAGYTTSACVDTSQNWQTPATSWFAELTAVGVKGYGVVNSNNATGGPAAMKALRDVGPQHIAIAAGNWQWYESGVFQNTPTNGQDAEWNVDHAVQLVGYGYDKELDQNYWIVRNSWSTLWGEDGFIRLWRAKEGQPEPCSPLKYGPVCGTSGILSDIAYPIVYEATPTMFG
uniref:Peptidase C1A papain C-terminal domain-containing protein n=1 Tax=Neobodo designis TaxID=312471 RepID=A0A7S1LE78_NEODS|mmetsp:Transcript_19180/g.59570  ORF Transcript_19180/g.59570 Transcript_19180/m.59570 type:complete len:407 (+) Transcript_19180:49-1269(+)